MDGTVVGICIAPLAGGEMEYVDEVEALARQGLKGDRYATGNGSFNKTTGVGHRQVTLINSRFFEGTTFKYRDSRRNIVTSGVELMWLIGREFQVGNATLRGIKYCDPCDRPSKLSGKPGFKEAFQDCGGLVAEILISGTIRIGDTIVPPRKEY